MLLERRKDWVELFAAEAGAGVDFDGDEARGAGRDDRWPGAESYDWDIVFNF